MLEIVGGVLTTLTVSVKLAELVSSPSETKTVTSVTPVWSAAGVTVTVRLEPLPPNATLAAGTKVVLVEAALKVRLDATVSTSPTVKAMGPIGVLGGVL